MTGHNANVFNRGDEPEWLANVFIFVCGGAACAISILTNLKMYSAITKYRTQRESHFADRKARPSQSGNKSTVEKHADRASLVALRLINLYMICDFLIVTLYPASKIYTHCFRHDPPVSYAMEFIAASLISLQIVWVYLPFRAFGAIAVGERAPKVVHNKSPNATKVPVKSQAVLAGDSSLSDSKKNSSFK